MIVSNLGASTHKVLGNTSSSLAGLLLMGLLLPRRTRQALGRHSTPLTQQSLTPGYNIGFVFRKESAARFVVLVVWV